MIYPLCFLNILLFCRIVVYYYQRGKDKIPPRKKGKSLNTRKAKTMNEVITVEFTNGVVKTFEDSDEILALTKAINFADWKGIDIVDYWFGDYED